MDEVQLVVEETELDHGVAVVVRVCAAGVRVAFDPGRVDRGQLEVLLNIYGG